jgi:HK97 family phage major capsid protein
MSDDIRLRELQSALREKMADNKTIADSFKVEDGTVVVSAEQKSAFDRNMSDIREIKSLIEGIESMRDAEKWASEPSSESVASSYAAQPVAQQLTSREIKSLGEAFLDSEEFKSLKSGRNGANMVAPYVYNVKDVFTGMPTGPVSPLSSVEQFGTFQRDPMVVAPTRTRRVRDLFPKRTTNAAVIEYFRQIGYTSPSGMTPPVNNAGMVAERSGSPAVFTAKPTSGLKFTGHQAPVRTMAHWEAAHRNVLADEPQLRSIIDNELMYGLRLLEDDQILNGDGTGEELEGVLETSGIQTYSWSSGGVGDLKADAIRRAATLSFLAYYEPTGVVMHPNDWEDIELSKDDNGQYLVAVSVALGGQPRLWRIPVVDTPAIAEGTALVGAFGTAAQIYDRETASIRISEQHADFFVRNAIVILAEQRLALAVKRPEAFVKVTFDGAPA